MLGSFACRCVVRFLYDCDENKKECGDYQVGRESNEFINYQKWRQLIYKTNLLCMLSVLVTEIAMYYVFQAGDLLLQPIPVYLFFDGNLQEYRGLTKRLLVEFAATEYDFTDTSITISGGIAQWEQGCLGEELFMRADKALYVSKASGKNRLTTYDKATAHHPCCSQIPKQ